MQCELRIAKWYNRYNRSISVFKHKKHVVPIYGINFVFRSIALKSLKG